MSLRALLRWSSRIVLPPRCLVCGDAGDGELDLCAACRAHLPWNVRACARCGLPLAEAQALECGACRLSPPPFEHACCALRYTFPVDHLLPRFKFHGDLAAGALLAHLLQWTLDPGQRPQALLPVPLHHSRLRRRGYDQALEIARVLSRETGVRLQADVLQRARATQAQTRLGASDRRSNVEGAFRLRPGAVLPAHVALVDDVWTTGATLRECAVLLRRAGVQRVDAWTVARA